MNDVKNFQEQIALLNDEIRKAYSDNEEEIFPIYDGALNPEEYFMNPSYKILWLMKEPYDGGEREGEWSLPDFFIDDYDRFYNDLIKGSSGRTWQPAVYASYGILNNFTNWDEMSYIRDEPSMVKVLGKIAWVNIQKLPSETGKKTDIKNVHDAYKKHKVILNKQIELLNPDIIICGNTFSVIREDLGNPVTTKFDMVEYFFNNGKLFINAYHPAQFQISRERYVNNIIQCAKEWEEQKRGK